MDDLVKKKWIEALRSGMYDQSKLALRKEDGFCCLGVLCDVLSGEVGGEWKHTSSDLEDMEFHAAEASHPVTESLPKSVQERAELDEPNPQVPVPENASDEYFEDDSTTLAELNDQGFSFEEIADVIEQSL
jgi:hypothetical protein